MVISNRGTLNFGLSKDTDYADVVNERPHRPLRYARLTARFRLNWRREAAFEAGLLFVELAVGFLLGRL